jgi:5-methylcytosine-specific restriction endonuclease McrA
MLTRVCNTCKEEKTLEELVVSESSKFGRKDAVPEDYDRSGVLAMYNLSQKISKLTGVQMHVDHIVPLALGGKHNVTNLQLLAGILNVSKGIKTHWQLSHKAYPNVG